MTFTLAVVDEGLLDLTGFKTPDPWRFFYARQALGVSTMDLYDHVIGAYSGRIGNVLSIGGDEEAEAGEAKMSTQRFRPMVRFFGPYHLGARDARTIEFQMPEYIGSVRVMAIGGHKGAYGASDRTMPVRSPLMVQGTLPRVLATNERLSIPVTVFAMSSKVRSVRVSVQSNELIRVGETSSSMVSFAEVGDKTISFPIETTGKTGMARIDILAEGDGESARSSIDIEVRNPNPRTARIVTKQVASGKSITLSQDAFANASDVQGTVEVSGLPAIPFSRLMDYMREYPHSCLEQQTSRAFVQMLYPELANVSKEDRAQLSAMVNGFIGRVSQFQLPNGGFTLWPGYSTADYWATSYVGHFLQVAKERGYKVSPSLLAKWSRYQRTEANSWSSERARDNSAFVQAYRLYTLALAGSPQLGVMNRLRETKNLPSHVAWRLAAAYAVAGNKAAADQLVSGVKTSGDEGNESVYSYGSALRDRAMLLEGLTRLKQYEKALSVLQEISANMSGNRWLSTQEIGFGFLAISEFAKATKAGRDDVKGELTIAGNTDNIRSEAGVYRTDATPRPGAKSEVTFKNTSGGTLFVTLTVSGISEEPVVESTANNLSVRVQYFSMDNAPIDVHTLPQGSSFVARVEVSNPGLRGDLTQLALDFALPAGWEVRNTRMEGETAYNSSSAMYQDFRDDRVYTYFNLKAGEGKTFYFVVHASYVGTFTMPPTSCSALYDGSVNASWHGGRVTVE